MNPEGDGPRPEIKNEDEEESNEFLKAMKEDGLGSFMKFWIQRPLNEREIKRAMDEMNYIHPLKSVPIEEVFTAFRCLSPILNKFRKKD